MSENNSNIENPVDGIVFGAGTDINIAMEFFKPSAETERFQNTVNKLLNVVNGIDELAREAERARMWKLMQCRKLSKKKSAELEFLQKRWCGVCEHELGVVGCGKACCDFWTRCADDCWGYYEQEPLTPLRTAKENISSEVHRFLMESGLIQPSYIGIGTTAPRSLLHVLDAELKCYE